MLPLDLHVLSLSLAFILSQDQTLRCNYILFRFFRFSQDISDLQKLLDGWTFSSPLSISCTTILSFHYLKDRLSCSRFFDSLTLV